MPAFHAAVVSPSAVLATSCVAETRGLEVGGSVGQYC